VAATAALAVHYAVELTPRTRSRRADPSPKLRQSQNCMPNDTMRLPERSSGRFHRAFHARSAESIASPLSEIHFHLILSISSCDRRMSSLNSRRSAMASRVKSPCLNAFLLPRGAPDPGAPPCMRQRILPATTGERQGLPDRVLAPQRGLESIGPILRG
jgi:hypothetical protein